jgi:hypothetical protein
MSAPIETRPPDESAPQITSPNTTPYAPAYPQPTRQHELPPPMPPRNNRAGAIIAGVTLVVLIPALLCAGIALFAGAAGFYAATHQIEQTATSTMQLAVSNHPTIVVSDTAGQVTITNGATPQVVITATKRAHAASSSTAQQMLTGMTVAAMPTASGAQITATTGQSQPLSQQSIDLRITVPQTSDLRVTLYAGTLQISSISGVMNVTDSAGTVNLRGVTLNDSSSVHVATGTIYFDGSLEPGAAAGVTVGTGTAAIELPQTSATHLVAATQVGGLTITGWPATISQTGAGRSTAVDLNASPTNTLTVRVDVGTIRVVARQATNASLGSVSLN